MQGKDLAHYKNIIIDNSGALKSYFGEDSRIGDQSGVYGFNWAAYHVDSDTVLIDAYRSYPKIGVLLDHELSRKIRNKLEEKRRKQNDAIYEKRKAGKNVTEATYDNNRRILYRLAKAEILKAMDKQIKLNEAKRAKEKALKLKQRKMTNKKLTKMSRGV